MDSLLLVLAGGLMLVTILMIYRLLKGPTVYDRLNGLIVLGTNAILMVLVVGVYIERIAMVVDISLAFAILGFVSWVILAKYFGEKGDTGA